jgi:polyisoprenoid-binding protein YceI
VSDGKAAASTQQAPDKATIGFAATAVLKHSDFGINIGIPGRPWS